MLELELGDGERMWITDVEADVATVECTRPAPPGSTLEGTSPVVGSLRVKVRSCTMRGDRYVLQGRLIDVRRRQREHLIQRISAKSNGTVSSDETPTSSGAPPTV